MAPVCRHRSWSVTWRRVRNEFSPCRARLTREFLLSRSRRRGTSWPPIDGPHVELWRLGGLSTAPVLETVLLTPPLSYAGLAFSDDGQRLVAASTYALAWDTRDWREVGRGAPGTFSRALTPSDALEISPDGSHIATPSGLWRIAPEIEGAREMEPLDRGN